MRDSIKAPVDLEKENTILRGQIHQLQEQVRAVLISIYCRNHTLGPRVFIGCTQCLLSLLHAPLDIEPPQSTWAGLEGAQYIQKQGRRCLWC